MYGQKIKRYIFPGFMLIAFLIPVYGFNQESKRQKRINWSYDYIEKAAKIPIVQEAMLDSVNQKLGLLEQYKSQLLSVSQLKETSFINKITGLKKNLKNLQISDISPSSFLSKLPLFYSLKEQVNSITKNSFSFGTFSLTSQTLYDNYFLADKQFLSASELSLSSTIANIPFSYQFNYIYPSFLQQDFSGVFKASFDKEVLLNNVKKQLTSQFDIEKILLKDFDFKQLFHQYAESKLALIKQSIKSLSGLQPLLKNINNISTDEFLYLTRTQIREKLTNKNLMDSLLFFKERRVQELVTTNNSNNKKVVIQQLDSITTIINAANETIEKILSAKNDFETSGLNYNQLVNYQNSVNNNIDSITHSDQFVQQASKKLLKLSGLTKLFMHVKEMNIGKFSTNWSERSMSNVLSSGVGGSYLKNNKFIGLNISNIQSLGWIKDNRFLASLQQPEAAIQSLRIGKGELKNNHSHLTFTNGNIKNMNSPQAIYSLLPRNIFIGSFSKNLSLGSLGNVETEVSKSSTQYSGTRNFQNENQVESKLALIHLGEDFFQALSVGFKYYGNFSKIHFKPSVFANYSGLGYINPASSSQSRGAVSYGINMSKNFFSNTLTLHTRFSKRTNRTSVTEDKKFNQLQGALSAKYKLSRKLKVGLNWTYSGLSKLTDHSNEKLYYSNRIYSEVSFTGKVRNLPLFQFLNMGYQNISIPNFPSGSLGKTFWINSATNMAMNKGTLSVNLQLFNQLDRSIAQGDLLTTDLGWTFTAFRSLNLTTAINYLNQQHVAKQMGVRQTIFTSIKDKLNISLFADLRKDIIQNRNSFLFPNTRGELAITYKLIK